MLLGYNTNGFAHHDPLAAVELLAEIGYRSVAITLDHGVLNPYGPQLDDEIGRMRDRLLRLGLRSVIETGARYLLDPREKHEPTLVSSDAAGRRRRVDFLCRAAEIARRLGSDCVSLWSGVLREPLPEEEALDRLAAGLREVLDFAGERGMVVSFEPEPGMLVATTEDFARLAARLEGRALRLTLDIGHLQCSGELPIAAVVRRWAGWLANVHLEDSRAGVHEHLMFGEGEIDFPPVLAALAEAGYAGGLHVELSRHSHEAPRAARRAYGFLEPLLGPAGRAIF